MDIFVISAICLLFFFLVFSKHSPALLFAYTLTIFLFLNLINIEEVLKNFTNEALVIVVLLLLISQVVEKTDTMNSLSKLVFKEKAETSSMLKLTSVTMFLSAFINNTPLVASLLGLVKNNKIYAPSKFLIPLVFAASLGGMITLIGTSTNLIVNGLVINEGLVPFRMFDFAYVGIPVAVAGLLFLVLSAYKLLPEINHKKEEQQLIYFLEARVDENSLLIGKTIKENRFRNLNNLFLANIIRDNKLISPVSPNEIIAKNDILVFTGDVSNLVELEKFNGLKIIEEKNKILLENLREVIVSHNSNLIGKTIKESNFRSKFDAAVVAVRRRNEQLSGKLGSINLQPGDYLILEAGNDFDKRENLENNFYLVNKVQYNKFFTGKHNLFIIASFLSSVIFSALGLISLLKALLLNLIIFILFKYIQVGEIRKNFPLNIILLIGCSLGISEVMISTGASKLVSDIIIDLFGQNGVYGSFIGIFIFTAIITNVITNNAAAALAFPIAYSTALALNVSPMPFIMAVAFAASAAFITPFGYQTNLMAYTAGQYRFVDFVKVGLPLTIIYSIISLVLIPVFFKF